MISIKTEEEIAIMAEGGKILAQAVEETAKLAKPGITTKELDIFAEKFILKAGAKPAFKGYKGYPATICSCVNDEVVHCIPSERVLKDGEILTIDCGVLYKGFNTDMAVTVPIGEVDHEVKRMIRVCRKALKRGIKQSKIGSTFGDIGNTIQRFVESQGFEVIKELCGHGIGREVHEEPEVLNFGKRHTGLKLEKGMVFCIEPMITFGGWRVEEIKGGAWGYKTISGNLAVHWEDTVAITENGPKVLTKI